LLPVRNILLSYQTEERLHLPPEGAGKSMSCSNKKIQTTPSGRNF